MLVLSTLATRPCATLQEGWGQEGDGGPVSAPGHCTLCQDACLEASTLRAVSRLMPWADDEPPAEGLEGLGGREKLAGGGQEE